MGDEGLFFIGVPVALGSVAGRTSNHEVT